MCVLSIFPLDGEQPTDQPTDRSEQTKGKEEANSKWREKKKEYNIRWYYGLCDYGAVGAEMTIISRVM